jgi:hypothetical protein
VEEGKRENITVVNPPPETLSKSASPDQAEAPAAGNVDLDYLNKNLIRFQGTVMV